MNEILFASASALARAIRDGIYSSQEVVQAHLDRITLLQPRINAVSQLLPDALNSAGKPIVSWHAACPVAAHGVPFTVKDVFETAGVISPA